MSDAAAVVLAAGFSSRMRKGMGEAGFKPLMTLGERTFLGHVLEALAAVGVSQRIVVTGFNAAQVAAAARDAGARCVHNPGFADGMFGSVVRGVAALPDSCARFFVWPVDIPLVRPETLALELQDFAETRPDILLPTFLGERGHPPLCAARMREHILSWNGFMGLRGALEAWESEHPDTVRDFPTADAGTMLDADTPDDFALLQSKRPHIPVEDECSAAFALAGTPQRAVRHCKAVARVALAFARCLETAQGVTFDHQCIAAAATLHDVAKGKPQHEREGGRFLARLGFHGVADIVADHRDMACDPAKPVTEKELVFMADKLVAGTHVVSVRQRYGVVLERHGHDPRARTAINGRLGRALAWQDRLQRLTGCDLEQVARDTLEHSEVEKGMTPAA